MKKSEITWTYLGLIPYETAIMLQIQLREEILTSGRGDILLLMEHHPVFTLGCGAQPADIIVSSPQLKGIDVVRTDRGGLVTYHGPGQLVGYPILNLQKKRLGTREYVLQLSNVLIALLAGLGLVARWKDSHPGIWIEERKIASVGIHVHRHVSTHGFALNVSNDLSPFSLIVPCGIPECSMTSVEKERGKKLEPIDLADAFALHFGRIMMTDMSRIEAGPLLARSHFLSEQR